MYVLINGKYNSSYTFNEATETIRGVVVSSLQSLKDDSVVFFRLFFTQLLPFDFIKGIR